MDNEFLKWLGGVVASVSVTGIIGYLYRDTLGRFMTKSVEHQFDKKIERFKADIRAGEKQLEQVQAYLISARTGRESILQEKKVEAAERLMHIRKYLCGFSTTIEYLKILKVDELLRNGGDQKVIDFVNAIASPLNIDKKLEGYAAFDTNTPKLYLSEKTINIFEAYESIMLHGAATIKVLEIPLGNKVDFIAHEHLSEKIIKLIPSSKEGFEKHGGNYVFQWADYFHVQILNELRNELIGAENMDKDKESAARIALDSHSAQLTIQAALKQFGLSESLVNSESNGK